MPHPFGSNYYPNTGAFGPDGLLYVAEAAGGYDDSYGMQLYHSMKVSTGTTNTSPLPVKCSSGGYI